MTVRVVADAPGQLTSTAQVAGDQDDPVAGNNSAAEATTVDKHPTTLTYNGASGPIASGGRRRWGAA